MPHYRSHRVTVYDWSAGDLNVQYFFFDVFEEALIFATEKNESGYGVKVHGKDGQLTHHMHEKTEKHHTSKYA